ncbi:MAG: NAD(P)H-hydrate dehydratase [Proteobacteria bacterium]|nr:NAD(P)H-hydrate dehydratase [Pseudomonadota bacterium]
MPRALAPICRIAEVRVLERAHADDGLMERAGVALATRAAAMTAARSGPIVVLAGPGNNGGDGFVAARVLRAQFHDVAVVFTGDPARLPADAAAAHAAFRAAGGTTVEMPPAATPALIIDALFGVGAARPLGKPYHGWVEWANASAAPILAVDVPTGLNADTGIATSPAIRADATLTFLTLKPGLLTAAGPDLVGQLDCDALGVEPPAAAGHCLAWTGYARTLPQVLARTTRNVHKGTFGTLAVVGGGAGMLGAPLLAARAALLTGAGKVQVGFAADAHPPLDDRYPELMLRDGDAALDGATAVVVGPGLGRSPRARALVAKVVALTLPLVVDADALNLIADDSDLRGAVASRDAPTLVTPHPAEAARLLKTDTAAITRDRLTAATMLANQLRAHAVLKGAGSVIAHPDGHWAINTTGNAALAAAGTGDVLAGMLGALLAQRIAADEALELGVCLHGAAADALVARGVGPLGVPASEIALAARDLLNAR